MFYTDLKTERLTLINISKSDREFIYTQFSDPVVTKYLYDEEPLTGIDGADQIIDMFLQPEPRGHHRWIIQRKTDDIKIGTCGVHCWDNKNKVVEIGYDLQKEFWGNGYMYEALEKIIDFAKDMMDVNEIQACIYVNNNKSINLIEKLGFVAVGTKYEVFRGKDYLHNIYSLKFSDI